MRARIGRSLGTGVARKNVQHARAKFTVLVLLTPHTGRQIHQWSECAIGPAEGPHAREFVGIDGGILADETDST